MMLFQECAADARLNSQHQKPHDHCSHEDRYIRYIYLSQYIFGIYAANFIKSWYYKKRPLNEALVLVDYLTLTIE